MKNKKKAYEENLDEQLAKINAQIALLKAGPGEPMAEADIEYFKTIEAFITAEER